MEKIAEVVRVPYFSRRNYRELAKILSLTFENIKSSGEFKTQHQKDIARITLELFILDLANYLIQDNERFRLDLFVKEIDFGRYKNRKLNYRINKAKQNT